jgi:hypothetical protein
MGRGKRNHDDIVKTSLPARLLMHKLMAAGMSEADARRQALPGNRLRKRTQELWEKHGLWPNPPELVTMPAVSVESPQPEAISAPDVQPPVREVQKSSETITRQEFENTVAGIESHLREVEAKMSTFQIHQNRSDSYPEEAPRPPSEGRKGYTVARDKLGITLDPELHKLVLQEAKRRGISISRVFDTALWHYYGKPRLSFEPDDAS